MTTDKKTIEMAADMVKRFHRKDSLTDEEFRTGIDFITPVISFLEQCGPEYELVRRDLERIVKDCDIRLRQRACARRQGRVSNV
jgi:hypothetical protein